MTHSLRSLITKDAVWRFTTTPNLPKDTWHFIVGSTLSTLNRPDETARILQFALRQQSPFVTAQTTAENLKLVRRMREAMIKLAAIAGLPKTINALLAVKNVTPPELLDEPLAPSPTLRPVQVHDMPPSRVLQVGQRFFDSIYGKISKRVMGQMDRSGTEDLGITARLMYGYILSNTAVLSPVETSYVLLAGLIPQDVNPQLKGHLKGALNNGATADEVRAVRALVLNVCEMYGMRPLQFGDTGYLGWHTEVADV